MDSSETAFNKWEKKSAINCCSIDRQKTTDTAENVHVVVKDMAHRWHSPPKTCGTLNHEKLLIILRDDGMFSLFFLAVRNFLFTLILMRLPILREKKLDVNYSSFVKIMIFLSSPFFEEKKMKKDYNNLHSFDIFLITSRHDLMSIFSGTKLTQCLNHFHFGCVLLLLLYVLLLHTIKTKSQFWQCFESTHMKHFQPRSAIDMWVCVFSLAVGFCEIFFFLHAAELQSEII